MGIPVDGLDFTFPAGWAFDKYDEWAYYRGSFSKMRNDIKAVDLLAIDPNKTVWLIEVKDYRVNPRTKSTNIADEFAQKVFDTLAALLPARVRAVDPAEVKLARLAMAAKDVRAVLHVEQPAHHSKLFPRAIDVRNVTLKLRRLLKAIDPHPFVAEMAAMGSLPWTVR